MVESNQKPIRIFVSGKLVKSIEDRMPARPKTVGRPTSHSTCMMLAILAVKSNFGIGYRKTLSVFHAAGYPRLPNFRTVSWRASQLIKSGIKLRVSSCERKNERWVVIGTSKSNQAIENQKLSDKAGRLMVHGFGLDYVELAL